jgi:hypothetical protein
MDPIRLRLEIMVPSPCGLVGAALQAAMLLQSRLFDKHAISDPSMARAVLGLQDGLVQPLRLQSVSA